MKAEAAAKRRPLLTAAVLRKRSAAEPPSSAPPPKLAKTKSPERSTAASNQLPEAHADAHHFEHEVETKSPERSMAASNQPELPEAHADAPYFEHQVELRCGIHALNNMLGFHLLSPEDMARAADAFIFENRELADNIQDHLAPAGDYSIEVMDMVLRTKAMEVYGQVVWEQLSGSWRIAGP